MKGQVGQVVRGIEGALSVSYLSIGLPLRRGDIVRLRRWRFFAEHDANVMRLTVFKETDSVAALRLPVNFDARYAVADAERVFHRDVIDGLAAIPVMNFECAPASRDARRNHQMLAL